MSSILRLPVSLFALAIALLLDANQASAVCTPAAANGVFVECSGATVDQNAPNGYGTGAETNITVNVLGGASVTGAVRGISASSISALFNYGTIGIGATSSGVFANTIANLTNIGTIEGGVEAVLAIELTNLINHGTIRGRRDGITVGGTLSRLVNYGTIIGDGRHGVFAVGLLSLTNAGVIIGPTSAQRSAIIEWGAANTTLTLLPGSNIQGLIDLGGGVNTLNVGNGLSIANTFVFGPRLGGNPSANAPVIGTTYGAPFAVNGNQIAVVDPTLEAFQDEVLIDLTNGIFEGVSARLDGLSGGTIVGVTRQPLGAEGIYKGTHMPASADRHAWAHAFGATRSQDATAPTVDADHQLGGMMSGIDAQVSAGLRAGFFLGGSWSDADTAFNSQEEEIETFFGGVYGQRNFGRLALDATITVGHSQHERERQVANNLVAGGIQTATGDFDGTFIAAALDLETDVPVGTHRVTPSVHFRYAGQFLDSFVETGATGNLALSAREVHVLQGRGQLALPLERMTDRGGLLRAELKVGVEGRTNVGDDAFSAVLLGQNIVFAPGGEDTVVSIYGGAGIAFTLPQGRTKLTANVEGGLEEDGSSYANGRAGAKIVF